ncbi:MAG: hypothetical protein COU69_03355 [Candidatus Pacebacteria bacterium CG10_big_fil_rev_8_21_14_0_10_56_10]|nr:MAG: hypothetical protein COU69_03355 [Candidatus Pacebacteria bacterium CG10_big_fil_rev_8_21_14_0_10_56_10]
MIASGLGEHRLSMLLNIDRLTFTIGSFAQVVTQINQAASQGGVTVLPASLHDLAMVGSVPQLLSTYQQLDIITADGMPLVWWSRWKTNRQVERVYGPELMTAIGAAAQQRPQAFLGTDSRSLQLLKHKLLQINPQLNWSWSAAPPFGLMARDIAERYASQLQRVQPNILWIGLSSPLQVELGILLHQKLPDTTIIMVGAAFEFITGTKVQAPAIIRSSGMEWAFRLATEPRRLWRRYAITIPRYVLKILAANIRRHS